MVLNDEIRAPNSCEFVGMINFMKLLCEELKLHSCCWCCVVLKIFD